MKDVGLCFKNVDLQSIDGKYKINKLLQLKDLNIESFSQQVILFTASQQQYQNVYSLNINDMSFTQLQIKFYSPIFLLKYLVFDYRQLIYTDDYILRYKIIKCLIKQQTKKKMQFRTKVQYSLQSINQYIFLAYSESLIRFHSKHNLKLIRKLKIQSDSISCIRDLLLIRRLTQIKLFQIASLQKVRIWNYDGDERIFQQSLNNKNELFLRTYSYENGQKLVNLDNGSIIPISIDQQITDTQLWIFANEILNVTLLPDFNIQFFLDVRNIDQLSLKAFQEGDITIVSFKCNDYIHIYRFQQKN